MSLKILPYMTGSASVRALADALDCKVLRLNTQFTPGRRTTILNWGHHSTTVAPRLARQAGRFINTPEAVEVASNKLATYQALIGKPYCPEYTDSRDVALRWLGIRGQKVLSRALTRASEGRGIILHENAEDVPHVPLYVKYYPKRNEYRVHVFNGEVISVQEKKGWSQERIDEERVRSPDFQVNKQIRNFGNGWVFTREGVEAPGAVAEAARDAVSTLGLDFGAVDIGWNTRNQRAVVYEVNTAPGLEGTTVEDYARAIRQMVDRGWRRACCE
jgi:glutathione synthase/RimK-type ligase-like ATP-grasp enzyme